MKYSVDFVQNSPCTLLGRWAADDGSGSATGQTGEGNWITQADVSTITCDVYDIDSATPGVAVVSPSVVVADAILDTPTVGTVWGKDAIGYNFIHTVPSTAFPTALHEYVVEYCCTLAGGFVFYVQYQGKAARIWGA